MHTRPLLLVVALLAALGMGVWWSANRSPGTWEVPQFEPPILVKSEPQPPVLLQAPEPVQEGTRLPEESVPEPRATQTTAGGVTPSVAERASFEGWVVRGKEMNAEERRHLEDKLKRYLGNQQAVSKQE